MALVLGDAMLSVSEGLHLYLEIIQNRKTFQITSDLFDDSNSDQTCNHSKYKHRVRIASASGNSGTSRSMSSRSKDWRKISMPSLYSRDNGCLDFSFHMYVCSPPVPPLVRVPIL